MGHRRETGCNPISKKKLSAEGEYFLLKPIFYYRRLSFRTSRSRPSLTLALYI